MINKYRRAARTAAELELGPLRPLDEVIPELTAPAPDGGAPSPAHGGSGGAEGPASPPATDRSGLAAACAQASAARAQACAHAGLNVADGGVAPPQSPAKYDVWRPDVAPLNPLIGVR